MGTTEVLFIFLLFLFLVKSSHCKNYANYTLFRGMPVNVEHLEFFRNISDTYDVNFWRPPSRINRPVEFVMPPEQKSDFISKANEKGIYLTTIMSDVQSAFDQQIVRSYIRRNMKSFDWRSYFRLKDIYSWLKDLQKMYPKEIRVFSIGKTEEERDIMGVKIALKDTKHRSSVFIEGGIHAREWISPAMVTYMISEIIHAPSSKDKQLKEIAHLYDWYLVPVLNPDGYEFTHTSDRLWRKNRSNKRGVDINRNFPSNFGTVGISRSAKSEIYCGQHAFSEKESIALAELVKAKADSIEYFISFHSYGQLMILPYEYSTEHVENYYEVKDMCVSAAKKIQQSYGTKYKIGTAYDTVGYKTSGCSSGWVKKQFRVPYVITIELRDDGEDGFALPAAQILPTCQETMDGLVSFLTPHTVSFSKIKMSHHPDQGTYINLDRVVLGLYFLCFIKMYFI